MALILLVLMALAADAFVPQNNRNIQFKLYVEPSPQETAAALTAYMAKAHEEKVAAMARVEAKYKDEIAALKAKVAELEGPTTAGPSGTSNSFAFPATNRGLAEKVVSYQRFISKYIIKAQSEKQRAVKEAERATAAKYEAKIEAMSAHAVPPQ